MECVKTKGESNQEMKEKGGRVEDFIYLFFILYPISQRRWGSRVDFRPVASPMGEVSLGRLLAWA